MTAVACSVYSAKLMPAWTGEGPRGEGAPAGRKQGYPQMCLELANMLHGVAEALRLRALLQVRGKAQCMMECKFDATLHC